MFGRAPSMKSDNSRYYDILRVPKTASQDDLYKAYCKAYIKNDPRNGGKQDKLDELTQVYEVLSDPRKRMAYDLCGEDALKDLKNILGGGGSWHQRQRGANMIHPLEVSLEDLYNGTCKEFSYSRNVICHACKGLGSKTGALMECSGCKGRGRNYSFTKIEGTMYIMLPSKPIPPCNQCKGTRKTSVDKDRCPQCEGEMVVQEQKVLKVIIEKGMQNGQMITIPGEADEAPDRVTGDLVLVLQQKDHAKFKREGDDLFYKHTLSHTEAFCGFQFVLTHLDNRRLLVKSSTGEVIKPGQFKAMDDEGMPMYQKPIMRGKLYIHFTIEFPDSLTPDQCRAIEAVLPPKLASQLTNTRIDECVEVTLHNVDIEEEMSRKQTLAQEASDEDDEISFDKGYEVIEPLG